MWTSDETETNFSEISMDQGHMHFFSPKHLGCNALSQNELHMSLLQAKNMRNIFQIVKSFTVDQVYFSCTTAISDSYDAELLKWMFFTMALRCEND